MADDDEIIPLDLATTYPVRWSVFKVLRDFVQDLVDEHLASSLPAETRPTSSSSTPPPR